MSVEGTQRNLQTTGDDETPEDKGTRGIGDVSFAAVWAAATHTGTFRSPSTVVVTSIH